ncbi:APC family permease [Gallibacter sp. Marseille-QA0791]|uniref:APC family permease n=1 Tax=Gallibacter sp. Marseille-QA0791 TaxID=3378781 RepID=UPI002EB7E0D3|nr:APC family permease [Anaerovoracaceae bacterium]
MNSTSNNAGSSGGILRGDNSKIVAKDITIAMMLFMIFSFCCGGAFGVEEMVSSGGPGLTLILLAILPFVWALPQALTAAELGSAIPYTGGFYKWNQAALGEFWGFMAGWGRVIAQYIEMPGYVILSVGYIGVLLPLNGVEEYLLKAAIIILFTVVNLRGIKEVGWIATVISTLILIAFAGIAVIGFTHMEYSPIDPVYNPDEGFLFSLGGALALGMWMYSGFTSASTLAGDCKDKSVVWKSLLIALPIIALVYILPTAAGVGSLGHWQDWGDTINYGNVASLVGLGSVFVVIAVVGNMSCFNTCMTSLSRNFYAICEDNLGPKCMTKISQSRHMPYISILSVGIVALIGCTLSFDTLITITVTLLMVDYTLIWISLVALRIKHPELPRPFKIPIKSTAGIIAFVSPGWIVCIIALMVNGADYFLGGMAGVAIFPLLYMFFKRRRGGLTKLYPDLHPLNPKTKLAYGDLKRFAKLYGVLTIVSVAAIFFMPYYEGSWGPEYYAETYGFDGAFDFILSGINIVTVIYAVAAIVCALLARKYDNKAMRPEGLEY